MYNLNRMARAFDMMQADAGMASGIAKPGGADGFYIAPYGWGSSIPAGYSCSDAMELIKRASNAALDAVNKAYECAYEVETDDGQYDEFAGNVLCTDRGILYGGTPEGMTVIPGVAFTEDEDSIVKTSPTALVLTKNAGFQCVGYDAQNDELRAECPMATPVIVGTNHEPTAIIIPFSSREALENGRKFIDAMIDVYDEDESALAKTANIKGIGAVPSAPSMIPVAITVPKRPY